MDKGWYRLQIRVYNDRHGMKCLFPGSGDEILVIVYRTLSSTEC